MNTTLKTLRVELQSRQTRHDHAGAWGLLVFHFHQTLDCLCETKTATLSDIHNFSVLFGFSEAFSHFSGCLLTTASKFLA